MSNEAAVIPGQVDGRDNLTLCSAENELEVTFIASAGMIACSLLHRGEQLLELRGGIAAYEQRGSTFGIPILYPWANRLDGWSYTAAGRHVELDRDSGAVSRDHASGLPMHGLLAASPHWSMQQAGAEHDAATLKATLDFGAYEELLAAFPFPHRLEMTAGVQDARLTITTTVIPAAGQTVPVSFGFHPWLRLPGSDRKDWQIVLPVRRRMLLDGRNLPTGETQLLEADALSGPLGDRVFDDCFDELISDEQGVAVFSVADRHRMVSVELGPGFPCAQVYAPHDSQLICFEPMTAPVNALSSGDGLRLVEPGGSFSAQFAVAVGAA